MSPTSVSLTGNDTININVTLENLSRYSGEEVNPITLILFKYYMWLGKKNFLLVLPNFHVQEVTS